MLRNLTLAAITILSMLGAAPLLSACHTTAGAGADVQATGAWVNHTATKATP